MYTHARVCKLWMITIIWASRSHPMGTSCLILDVKKFIGGNKITVIWRDFRADM